MVIFIVYLYWTDAPQSMESACKKTALYQIQANFSWMRRRILFQDMHVYVCMYIGMYMCVSVYVCAYTCMFVAFAPMH
jgi:hypothetical protein